MKKITVKLLAIMMMLSMVFSSSALAATDDTKTSAWDSFTGLFTQAASTEVGVQYKTHIENKGTETKWVSDGDLSGTVGKGLRLEALWVELTGDNLPDDAAIKTSVHVQNKGDLGPFAMGTLAGTEGEGLRLERITLNLVNLPADYVIRYNVQVENKGWLKNELDSSTWFVGGQDAGTEGSGLRLEGIRIEITKTDADLTDYKAALALVNEVNKEDYTDASGNELLDTLDHYDDVTAQSTQEYVDEATEDIMAAFEGLVELADFEAYHEIIALTDEAVEADYTDESWSYLQETLEWFDDVTSQSTQADVNEATYEIEAAYDALVKLSDLEDAAIAAAITAAQDAITALPVAITLENADAVAAARVLVDAALVLDPAAVIAGTDALVAAELTITELQAQAAVDAAIQTAQEATDSLTLASATNVDTQEKVDAATALVQPAKDTIAALIVLSPEYDIAALNNAVLTAETNIANAVELLAAKALVVTAEDTLLDPDYDAAVAAVIALTNSDAKTLENAKLITLKAKTDAIIANVNAATNDVILYESLNVKPFASSVNIDLMTEYNVVLGDDVTVATITDVLSAIKFVNDNEATRLAGLETVRVQGLVTVANNATFAVTTFVTTPGEADSDSATYTQGDFEALVTAAETAIAALPADYKTLPADEITLAVTLQATVDTLVASNQEYVNKVAPVLNAPNAINIKNALVAAGVVRTDNNNITDYVFTGSETVADLQFAVDLKNAQILVNGDLTDQEKINKAQELVNFLPADVELATTKTDLQSTVDTAKTALTAANEAAAKLAVATTAVEELFTDNTEAALAVGIGQDAIDAAEALVIDLNIDVDVAVDTTSLLASIDAAQFLQDGVNLAAATTAVEELFTDNTEAALAVGVGQDAIDAAKALVIDLNVDVDVAVDTTSLLASIDAAQFLQDGVDLAAATTAVEELFTDNTEAALAVGVGQDAINAAKALVIDLNVDVDVAVDTASLLASIDTAQELLDVAGINAAIENNDPAKLQQIIVTLNVTDFTDLSKAQRSELVNFVIANSEAPIVSTTSFSATIITEVADYRAVIAAVNDANTKYTMEDALAGLNSPSYTALTSVQKLNVAETIYGVVNPLTFVDYTTFAQIQVAIDAAIAGL